MENTKIVVDLDETLIEVNSFKLWCKFLLKRSFITLNWNLFYILSKLLFQRKLTKRLSHFELKKQLTLLNLPNSWGIDFSEYLVANFLNDKVVRILEQLNVKEIIISTAAPESYAKHIKLSKWHALIICSKFQGDRFIDNFQKQKNLNLQEHLGGRDFIFFTDHKDDISSAESANLVYLVSTNKNTIKYYRDRVKNLKVIK